MVQDFFVKNMVCDRCIKVLRDQMEKHNIKIVEIELGRLRLDIERDDETEKLGTLLQKNGFVLIDRKSEKLVEQVKLELVKLLNKLPLELDQKLSHHLAVKMGCEYSKMSKIFSCTEEMTIEKYFIRLKIEKVKELIQDREYNFTEMAQLLDYSHINHLSGQFKKETGMSLSDYKLEQKNHRISLDRIM